MSELIGGKKRCKYCYKDISIDAVVCPYCQKKQKSDILGGVSFFREKSIGKKFCIVLGCLAIVLMTVFFVNKLKKDTGTQSFANTEDNVHIIDNIYIVENADESGGGYMIDETSLLYDIYRGVSGVKDRYKYIKFYDNNVFQAVKIGYASDEGSETGVKEVYYSCYGMYEVNGSGITVKMDSLELGGAVLQNGEEIWFGDNRFVVARKADYDEELLKEFNK